MSLADPSKESSSSPVSSIIGTNVSNRRPTVTRPTVLPVLDGVALDVPTAPSMSQDHPWRAQRHSQRAPTSRSPGLDAARIEILDCDPVGWQRDRRARDDRSVHFGALTAIWMLALCWIGVRGAMVLIRMWPGLGRPPLTAAGGVASGSGAIKMIGGSLRRCV